MKKDYKKKRIDNKKIYQDTLKKIGKAYRESQST